MTVSRQGLVLLVFVAAVLALAPQAGAVGHAQGAVGQAAASIPAAAAEEPPWVHALAMHGDPKYGPDFSHFDYVDPNAPKAGDIKLSQIGTFDSLNPFILEGNSPAGVLEERFYEYLTVSARDEPFTQYGLLAEAMQMPEDRKWVAFRLRQEARWSDGTPVTADDVVFSFNTIMEKGHPFYKDYWADVKEVVKIDDRTVRFNFDPKTINRELPLIMGQLPILQQAWWKDRDFSSPSLEIPVSSGPYKIDAQALRPGSAITLVRDPNYWGASLAVNVGRHNFDRMQWEFYRDSAVAMEAFKAGEYDWRYENSSKQWATAYDFPALNEGKVVKEEIPNASDQGMQGWVFNTRREFFKDKRVREALVYAFDFEFTNKSLMYNMYTRCNSFFSNSELGCRGLPEGEELAILNQFRDQLPPEVFTTEWKPPSTGGTEEGFRANLAKAVALLEEAGWTVKDGKLVNAAGQPMRFEILLSDTGWERLTGPYIDNLKKLGIEATMRTVDQAQYEERVEQFDFDMIVHRYGQSESPGNEQRNYWSCASAKTNGSQNYAGICDPVVDALIERVIAARSREDLVAATRALDRVLLWGYYLVPHWYIEYDRVAYWKVVARPATSPKYGIDLDTWFANTAEAEAIRAAQEAIEFVPPTEEAAAGAVEPTQPVTATEAVTTTEVPGPTGLSTTTIVLLAIGLLVVLGLALYFMRRPSEQA